MARIYTGIIAVPIVTGIVYYGSPLYFLIFVSAVVLTAVYEFFTMIDRTGVTGFPILGMVLSLPTVGPYLFRALMGQDMFMAGSLVMMLGIFTLIGTLISDLLLVIVDPRIRFDRKS